MRYPALPILLLLAAAPALAAEGEGKPPAPAAAPAPGTAPAATEAAAPAPSAPEEALPPHPVFETMGEALLEFQGGIEAGFRFVGGDDDGRYDQDVNLDDGFRLLAADVEGTSLRDGLLLDSLSFHARGLGDPDQRLDLRVKRDDAYDLMVHANRLESVFDATGELNPYETTRRSEGGRLRFQPLESLQVSLSTEHLRRDGDATLSQMYRDDQPFPSTAVLDYDGRFHSVGVDATQGVLRAGATWSWTRASDESWRVLDRPDTPERDTGVYRNLSDVDADTLAGRLGARLAGGRLDLSADGGYRTGDTDTALSEDATVSTDGLDGIDGTPDDEAWVHTMRGDSSAELRGKWWRGQALWRPRDDWEFLGWMEHRETDERGRLVSVTEDEPVGVDFGPGFRSVEESTAEAKLEREGLEARWRAAKEWRFRGGWERVRERVHTEEPAEGDSKTWSPVTRVLTGGADWVPSDRFDAGLLVRTADAGGAATQLSAGDLDSLSLLLWAKRPDGFHLTAWYKRKDRRESEANSDSAVDTLGFLFGGANADGFFELAADMRNYRTATDTRYVVDLVPGAVKTPHRVRYDEDVLTLTTTLSHRVKGPLRAFSSFSIGDASGDYDWVQYDASLGLGWRLTPSTELRLEARRVVFNEADRQVDDYRADLLTASVMWEF